MAIVLFVCFVVLMIVIRGRKGQSIPLEKWDIAIWLDLVDDVQDFIEPADYLDVTEEQRGGQVEKTPWGDAVDEKEIFVPRAKDRA